MTYASLQRSALVSARGGGILPRWLMSQAAKEINSLAGSQRAMNQGNLAPNHYWDKAANKIDRAATITLEKLKIAYLERGGQRENAAYGWVRATD